MATAAAMVAQKLYYPSTPGCEGKVPPLFEVSDEIGVNTSPADSTLTPAMTHLPPAVGGTSDVGFLEGFDDDAYDNALADEVIDDIIFDDNHGEKLAGNVVISANDMDDLDEEGEEEQGGDSDGEGDEADLHNIALARRHINDDLREQCYSKSTAEQIVTKHFGRLVETDATNNVIDDEVGEPTSGADEILVLNGQNSLPGAPEGWLPPSAPLTFVGYRPKAGEPSEEELDNPAGWSMFTFTPSYNVKMKKYDCHVCQQEHV